MEGDDPRKGFIVAGERGLHDHAVDNQRENGWCLWEGKQLGHVGADFMDEA